MIVTQIGHASVLIETQGLRILSDPWWRGPCFGAQWWIYPEPYLKALAGEALDYIYISHAHEDHLHPGTLKSLGTSARILVSESLDLAPHLRKLGYDVITVNDREPKDLGNGVSCRIVPTYGGDTFMTITDGRETLVNLNDAVHPLPRRIRNRFIDRIRRHHPKVDYVFCGHGVASHFPNCYLIPGKDYERTAQKRQLFFNHNWADIINGLSPRYGFPFAADVVLLEHDLFWSNQPVHDTERPPDVFRRLYPGAATAVMDIAPGFRITDGHIDVNNLGGPLDVEALQARYREKIERANRYGKVEPDELEHVKVLVQNNIEKHRDYLKSAAADYRALFKFHNTETGIHVIKKGSDIDADLCAAPRDPVNGYDISFTTRLPYLRRSLSTPYGHETLFVGSGGIFQYADAGRVRDNLHEELMVIMQPQGPANSRRIKALKRLAKALINKDDWDMYNLYRWTVWR